VIVYRCHAILSLHGMSPRSIFLSFMTIVFIQTLIRNFLKSKQILTNVNMVQPNLGSGTVAAAAPSLNVYKKVAVIRLPSDSLTYENSEGHQKSVSIQELGDAISSAVRINRIN
jgi:hypothetical protein